MEEALQLHTPVSLQSLMLLDSWRQQGSRHGCLERVEEGFPRWRDPEGAYLA